MGTECKAIVALVVDLYGTTMSGRKIDWKR